MSSGGALQNLQLASSTTSGSTNQIPAGRIQTHSSPNSQQSTNVAPQPLVQSSSQTQSGQQSQNQASAPTAPGVHNAGSPGNNTTPKGLRASLAKLWEPVNFSTMICLSVPSIVIAWIFGRISEKQNNHALLLTIWQDCKQFKELQSSQTCRNIMNKGFDDIVGFSIFKRHIADLESRSHYWAIGYWTSAINSELLTIELHLIRQPLYLLIATKTDVIVRCFLGFIPICLISAICTAAYLLFKILEALTERPLRIDKFLSAYRWWLWFPAFGLGLEILLLSFDGIALQAALALADIVILGCSCCFWWAFLAILRLKKDRKLWIGWLGYGTVFGCWVFWSPLEIFGPTYVMTSFHMGLRNRFEASIINPWEAKSPWITHTILFSLIALAPSYFKFSRKMLKICKNVLCSWGLLYIGLQLYQSYEKS